MKITGNTTLNELLPEGFEFETLIQYDLFRAGKHISLSFDFKEVKHSPSEDVKEPTFGYFEYKGVRKDGFTFGRIYKCLDSSNLEAACNFIDDYGKKNGFSELNHTYFQPSTKEAFDAQNVE